MKEKSTGRAYLHWAVKRKGVDTQSCSAEAHRSAQSGSAEAVNVLEASCWVLLYTPFASLAAAPL